MVLLQDGGVHKRLLSFTSALHGSVAGLGLRWYSQQFLQNLDRSPCLQRNMQSRFSQVSFAHCAVMDKRRRTVGDLHMVTTSGLAIKRPRFDQRLAAGQVVGFLTVDSWLSS
ncbi:hypothetical protein BDZ85DRAFT_2168 [Elsinoe ampelina]|uniref:Uncharacterized protein n=1 Tax=Elsinoe ampelina TaxID=302913 RepID=A0A6A6GNP6_9PEZI|nr:hypothetical protein BDZ85DRAFT_2168 [Elsinoe ampelina]